MIKPAAACVRRATVVMKAAVVVTVVTKAAVVDTVATMAAPVTMAVVVDMAAVAMVVAVGGQRAGVAGVAVESELCLYTSQAIGAISG